MKYSLFVILMLSSAGALATSITQTQIVKLSVNRQTGFVYVLSSTPLNEQVGRLACHTGNSWNYAFPLSNDVDQALYAMLLSAYATQKPISLIGQGQCPAGTSGNLEELKYATLIPD